MVHSWVNPKKPWATKFDDYEIAADDSFIMFGYGSPVDGFLNKEKAPGKLSCEELKQECIARIRAVPNVDPKFIDLAEKCVINTAYVHIVRDCQAVKRWETDSVTLIGDAVFKYVCYVPTVQNTLTLKAFRQCWEKVPTVQSLTRWTWPTSSVCQLLSLHQHDVSNCKNVQLRT
jgi:hypothetical protein